MQSSQCELWWTTRDNSLLPIWGLKNHTKADGHLKMNPHGFKMHSFVQTIYFSSHRKVLELASKFWLDNATTDSDYV